MKRQSSASNKSILHFFKAAPRIPQDNTTATTNTGSDNVSPPTSSSSSAPPKRAQNPSAGPSVSFSSNAATTRDTSADHTIRNSIEPQTFSASQVSATSGTSKRVTSNGQQMVLNSDSDSDSDLLGDLDFGLPTPKLKIPTYSGRSSRRIGLDEPELRRPPREGKKNSKRPFSQLMETAQKNLDVEREIQEHKAGLEKADVEPPAVAETLDEDTLKQALHDDNDDDKANRLYKAMQRTNEVQAQTAFHFFEEVPKSTSATFFPQKSLPDHGWTACFKDVSTREQAFLTGFASQVFRLQELPDELATWMIEQICVGRNTTLDQNYLEILKGHAEKLKSQLDIARLDSTFASIGAQVEILNAVEELLPTEAHASIPQSLPPSLKRVAALLTAAAPCLHSKARIHAFYLLCFVCLDDRVSSNADILNSVQDAMEAIICQYANNHKLASGVGKSHPDNIPSLIASQLTYIIPKLLSRVTHPLLQANLIHAFPTKSPLTAYLQRHLALSFLFHPATIDVPLADARLPGLIHAHLESSPHYLIRTRTDHSHLAARFTLLDVAIGPGPLSVPFSPLTSPAPSEAGSPPITAPIPTSSEVKAFNEEVDALAQHIKLLGNSIVETGAALDLTILEAKERCERLYWRLQHAVRIGGKKADNVFGDSEEARQPKVRNFFKPLPKKESIFDGENEVTLLS